MSVIVIKRASRTMDWMVDGPPEAGQWLTVAVYMLRPQGWRDIGMTSPPPRGARVVLKYLDSGEGKTPVAGEVTYCRCDDASGFGSELHVETLDDMKSDIALRRFNENSL